MSVIPIFVGSSPVCYCWRLALIESQFSLKSNKPHLEVRARSYECIVTHLHWSAESILKVHCLTSVGNRGESLVSP